MTADTSQAFQRLHQLLKQLDEADQAIALGPKRISLAEKKVAAAEQAYADQKEQLKLFRKEADQRSLTLKSRDAEMQKLNIRLNEASSNKEYDLIQAQIASRKLEDAALEDEILGMLSRVDEANAELQRLTAEVADLKKKQVETAEQVKSREPGLRSESERLNTEIREAEGVIPGGEPRQNYLRLRSAQGASAMARLEDGYCSECNTGVTPQDTVRMNMGEFVLCRACGRILYIAE